MRTIRSTWIPWSIATLCDPTSYRVMLEYGTRHKVLIFQNSGPARQSTIGYIIRCANGSGVPARSELYPRRSDHWQRRRSRTMIMGKTIVAEVGESLTLAPDPWIWIWTRIFPTSSIRSQPDTNNRTQSVMDVWIEHLSLSLRAAFIVANGPDSAKHDFFEVTVYGSEAPYIDNAHSPSRVNLRA